MPEDYRDPELEGLFRTLDHDPPPVTAEDVIARAESTTRRPERWRWAAGIALALGAAGVAYALPGSPLRDWVNGRTPEEGPAAVPSPPVAGSGPLADGAGVGLDAGSPQVIAFSSPRGGRVRVVLTDGPMILLEGPPDAARFVSEPGRLAVEADAPFDFELRVPRTAARVELTAAGRRLFLKDGDRIRADVPPGPDGDYLLPLDRAPR